MRVRDRIARRTATAVPAAPAAPAPASAAVPTTAAPASLASATRSSVERLIAAAKGSLSSPPEPGLGSLRAGAPSGDPAVGRPPVSVPSRHTTSRPPSFPPTALPAAPRNRTAAAKRHSAERLIAAILGKPPSPPGPAQAVSSTGASSEYPVRSANLGLRAPPSAKRRRLPTQPPAAAPAPTTTAALRRPPAVRARLHPALRRSSLPPNALRVPVPPGAPSPSCREATVAPLPDLDQRAAERERIARAARRSSALAAPERARRRPPSLRSTPPLVPMIDVSSRLPPAGSPQLPAPVQLTADVLAQLATPLPPPPPLVECLGLAAGTSPAANTKRSHSSNRRASPSARHVRARLSGHA